MIRKCCECEKYRIKYKTIKISDRIKGYLTTKYICNKCLKRLDMTLIDYAVALGEAMQRYKPQTFKGGPGNA